MPEVKLEDTTVLWAREVLFRHDDPVQ